MNKLLGMCTGLAAAAVGLLFTGSAIAAIDPTLSVTAGTGAANLVISGGEPSSGDPFAKVQVYVPSGYALNAPAGGATVGTVTGLAVVKDIDPTQEAGFSGKIVAIGPTDPSVAYENANCDASSHSAAWMMQLTMNDGQVNVPIFVDRTAGSEAAFGPYKLVVCLRSPDLAQSDPNRSPTGAKIDSFALSLSGFKFPTAKGSYRWRSLWTPYTPGTATVNTAGSVEAQSIVPIPAGALTISATKVRVKVKGVQRTQVKLSGELMIGGKAVAKVPVAIKHGASAGGLVSLGSVETNGAGAFLITSRLTKTTFFQAGATVRGQDLGSGGCTPSFGAGVQCLDAVVSGSRLVSPIVQAKP